MSEQSCHNCRFHVGQECHRHAPMLNPSDGFTQRWPSMMRPFEQWCGDWEAETPPQPEPVVIPPVVIPPFPMSPYPPQYPGPKMPLDVVIYGCQTSSTGPLITAEDGPWYAEEADNDD